jgi:phosphatidylglycerol:prolipoprotein diacylglycerol transferase
MADNRSLPNFGRAHSDRSPGRMLCAAPSSLQARGRRAGSGPAIRRRASAATSSSRMAIGRFRGISASATSSTPHSRPTCSGSTAGSCTATRCGRGPDCALPLQREIVRLASSVLPGRRDVVRGDGARRPQALDLRHGAVALPLARCGRPGTRSLSKALRLGRDLFRGRSICAGLPSLVSRSRVASACGRDFVRRRQLGFCARPAGEGDRGSPLGASDGCLRPRCHQTWRGRLGCSLVLVCDRGRASERTSAARRRLACALGYWGGARRRRGESRRQVLSRRRGRLHLGSRLADLQPCGRRDRGGRCCCPRVDGLTMTRAGFRWRRVRVPAYTALLYSGLLAGTYTTYGVARAEGVESGHLGVAILLLLVPAVLGARLAFVSGRWRVFSHAPRQIVGGGGGGAVAYGALLAVPVSVPLLVLLGVPVASFWDAGGVGFLVAVVLLRIGCLLNGCCCGRATSSRLGMVLPNRAGVRARRVPTQLIEVGWAVTLILVAAFATRRAPAGALFLFLVGAYALGRLGLDFTREHRRMQRLLTLPQWFSAVFVVLSLSGFGVLLVR